MTDMHLLLTATAVLLLPIIVAKHDACATAIPDFKAPGRRISEEKCREYNWQRKQLDKCSNEPANMKYPFMGAVGYKKEDLPGWSFLCAAFLVSPKYAVSAANCFIAAPILSSPPEIVRFGNRDILPNVSSVDAKILRFIVHPEFHAPKKAFDIALVELTESLPLSKSIMPACLWSQLSLQGIEDGIVPGWGTGSIGHELVTTMQVMKVKVLEKEACIPIVKNRFNRLWPEMQDHQICDNGSEFDVALCQGSSGAPVITLSKLDGEDEMPYALGVTSFGIRCPGWTIYTKVSSFIDWIEQNVWSS